mmetsp:Transcript_30575/g.79744  ORF Transcript_30575/g.79744 Transcript_30575/m.79744 type:complete len:221 (+) Transcript_30575:6074-6736(+)
METKDSSARSSVRSSANPPTEPITGYPSSKQALSSVNGDRKQEMADAEPPQSSPTLHPSASSSPPPPSYLFAPMQLWTDMASRKGRVVLLVIIFSLLLLLIILFAVLMHGPSVQRFTGTDQFWNLFKVICANFDRLKSRYKTLVQTGNMEAALKVAEEYKNKVTAYDKLFARDELLKGCSWDSKEALREAMEMVMEAEAHVLAQSSEGDLEGAVGPPSNQ